MLLACLVVLCAPLASAVCSGVADGTIIFRDIHDGDYKKATVSDGATVLTITPYNNQEQWVIKAGPFDENCATMVDFNVPGKPDPPPVKLLLKVASIDYDDVAKTVAPVAVFTDPSGTLADPTLPLNVWYGVSAGQAWG